MTFAIPAAIPAAIDLEAEDKVCMYQKSLLNIDSIINNHVVSEPWQHKIIDDILDISVYNDLKEALTKLSKLKKNDEFYGDGIWPIECDFFNLPNNIKEYMIETQKEFLSIKDQLLPQFENPMKSDIGYFGIPKFNYSIKNLESSIHDEGNTKTLALVIYLIPEKTSGTKLYSKNMKESFVKEIEWKPNRGFLMCSEPNKTWHSYGNNGLPRYTLNLYYEKLEGLPNVRSNSNDDRYYWFLNNMNILDLVIYN